MYLGKFLAQYIDILEVGEGTQMSLERNITEFKKNLISFQMSTFL
jgi:hypothetical protein